MRRIETDETQFLQLDDTKQNLCRLLLKLKISVALGFLRQFLFHQDQLLPVSMHFLLLFGLLNALVLLKRFLLSVRNELNGASC